MRHAFGARDDGTSVVLPEPGRTLPAADKLAATDKRQLKP